jgi:acyl carrier protein
MKTIDVRDTAVRLQHCFPQAGRILSEDVRLEDLALDSMDTVEFLCAIHEEFGIRLTETEYRPEQTIGGLIAIISTRTQAS